MATLPIIGNRGLHPSANPLTAPSGSQDIAENCVITSRDTLEPRRGQALVVGRAFGNSASRATAGGFFGETEVVHYGSALARDDGVSSAYPAYTGTFNAVDATQQRMKFIEAAVSLYVNSGAGVFVIDSDPGAGAAFTPVLAGVQRALDIDFANTGLTGNPDSGWMPTDCQVAYRALWGIIDANGRLKLGAPSGPHIIMNPADQVIAAGGITEPNNGYAYATTPAEHGFEAGDIVDLQPGEVAADIAAGFKTIEETDGVTYITSTTLFWQEDIAPPSTVEQTISMGSKDVLVRVPVPSGLTVSNFLRLYRSWLSETAAIPPTDEMYLVSEVAITAADIAAGYKDITDSTPESALQSGAPLYTNANTGEGALQANDRPPLCRDMCEWDDRMWFINTTDKHRFHLSLLGVGSPSGLQDGDFICIAGQTYRAKTITAQALDFRLWGQDTAGMNMDRTARFLVAAINANASSTVFAWYESAGSDLPGKILLEERTIAGDAFYVGASRATCWGPALPTLHEVTEASSSRTAALVTVVTATVNDYVGGSIYLASNSEDANFPAGVKLLTAINSTTEFEYEEEGAAETMTGTYRVHAITAASTSKNDRHKNGLSYSKRETPDAAPFTNWLPVGPDNHEVLRAVPLQDKLLVFTEVGGIYVVTRGVPYSASKMDATATLVSPDSAVAHSNRVFAFTTQGVCSISDAGVRVLSFDFEEDLLELRAVADTEVRRYAFGVSYESDRQYQLWLPSAAGDTCCTQAYVYNSMADTWTHWTGRRTWGAVQPKGNLLHLGDADTNKTRVERKSYDSTDYADEALAVTISDVSGKTITLASVSGVSEGDMLWQSEALKSLIVSVDSEANTVETLSEEAFTAAAASVLIAYECSGLSAAIAPGGPAVEKNFRGIHYHFKKFYARQFTAQCDSEKSTALSEEAIQELGFGLTAFGATPFGSPVTLRNRRVGVAQAHARSTHLRVGFTIREARAQWKLHGVSVDHELVGERSSR